MLIFWWTLREKRPFSEFFWSTFSRIRIKYRNALCKSPYSVRVWNKTPSSNTFYAVEAASSDLRIWYKRNVLKAFSWKCSEMFRIVILRWPMNFIKIEYLFITNILGQICEFRSSFISCSPGQILDIKYAFFGRKDSRVCKHGNKLDSRCSADAMELVQYHCQNKQFCFVNADAGQFGDPCPSIAKYLEFEYECIPKGLLQNLVIGVANCFYSWLIISRKFSVRKCSWEEKSWKLSVAVKNSEWK